MIQDWFNAHVRALSANDQRVASQTWGVFMMIMTSMLAVAIVMAFTLASMFLVFSMKSVAGFLIYCIWLFSEIGIAIVAAITSGTTVTLAVISAATVAVITFSPSFIEARICISMAVAFSAITASATLVLRFASFHMDVEIAAAVVTAAAVAVAFASSWAVGVMSLIERETRQVGLKMTSILDAVRHNNYRILRFLVKFHAGLKRSDINLALLHSVKAGFPDCTQVLIGAGADPNAHDPHENTPLVLACETGSHKIVRILLENGCDVNLGNGHRVTALHSAAKWGYVECVSLLLEYGANCEVRDCHGMTPMMLAAGHAHQAERIMRLLINRGCEVNVYSDDHKTALHHAAARGVDISILLDAGACPYANDAENNTPLHFAAYEGHLSVIDKLLKRNCDPNTRNMFMRTPVHLACARGITECINCLWSSGGDLTACDNVGHLPVWFAANNGRLAVVRYLLRRNCPLGHYRHKVTPGGIVSPLVAALQNKHLDVIKVLLLGGCDPKPLFEWLTEVCSGAELEHGSNITWLRGHLCNPDPLTHLCRLLIRSNLDTNILETVEQLPLPSAMRDFLTMKDLEDWENAPDENVLQWHPELAHFFDDD